MIRVKCGTEAEWSADRESHAKVFIESALRRDSVVALSRRTKANQHLDCLVRSENLFTYRLPEPGRLGVLPMTPSMPPYEHRQSLRYQEFPLGMQEFKADGRDRSAWAAVRPRRPGSEGVAIGADERIGRRDYSKTTVGTERFSHTVRKLNYRSRQTVPRLENAWTRVGGALTS